jgi:hypothetical protein
VTANDAVWLVICWDLTTMCGLAAGNADVAATRTADILTQRPDAFPELRLNLAALLAAGG